MSGELKALKVGQYAKIDILMRSKLLKFCCMAQFFRYGTGMLTLKAVEGVKNHLKARLNIMC